MSPARPGTRRRAARSVGPRRATPKPQAAAAESVVPWRAGLLLALGLGLAWPLARVLKTKVAEHVVALREGPLLEQGEAPGRVSGLLGLKATPAGGVVSLSRLQEAGPYRVQVFGPDLELQAWKDFQASATGSLSDLAVQPDGQIWLAGRDGRLWKLAPGLRLPARPLPSGGAELLGLDCLADGSLVGLDRAGKAIRRWDREGRPLEPLAFKALASRSFAVVPEGLAVLEGSERLAIRILDLQGRSLRRWELKGIKPAAPVRVGASGSVLLINDAGGNRGVVYYHVSGKPLGNSVGIGKDPVLFSGFLAGGPAGKAFVHYGLGLVKVRLPWREEP